MNGVRHGVVRGVPGWDSVGSEADGSDHPVVVVSRGAVNRGRAVLVVPSTSASAAHENRWEVVLDGGEACALVSGLRAVPIDALARARGRLVRAGLDAVSCADLRQIAYVLRGLLDWSGRVSLDGIGPGVVFDAVRPGSSVGSGRWMVSHYNRGNRVVMAMRMREYTDTDGVAGVPILSVPGLWGWQLVSWDVRELSLEHRLGEVVGRVADREYRRAVSLLRDMVAGSTDVG